MNLAAIDLFHYLRIYIYAQYLMALGAEEGRCRQTNVSETDDAYFFLHCPLLPACLFFHHSVQLSGKLAQRFQHPYFRR